MLYNKYLLSKLKYIVFNGAAVSMKNGTIILNITRKISFTRCIPYIFN